MLSPVRVHTLALAIKRRFMGAGHDPYPSCPGDIQLSPSSRHVYDYDAAPLHLAWQNSGGADAGQWQQVARAKLAELTGYSNPGQSAEARHEQKHELADNLIRKSCYLHAGTAHDIPVHLIFDPALSGPLPVMICLQGTNSGVHLSWAEVRLPADVERIARGSQNALQAAARGYVAVAVEQSCFGTPAAPCAVPGVVAAIPARGGVLTSWTTGPGSWRDDFSARRERSLAKRSGNPCIDAANHALLLGRTLLGERASDVSAVVNWLHGGAHGLALDLSRLYIMGNSSGGSTALYSSALDLRIQAALVGGSTGFLRDSICRRGDASGQNVVPGILNWLEMDDIVALSAPRPMLLFAGREDHIWPYAGAEAVAESARAVYHALGAADRLRTAAAEGGHSYHPDVAWPAFEALMAEGG